MQRTLLSGYGMASVDLKSKWAEYSTTPPCKISAVLEMLVCRVRNSMQSLVIFRAVCSNDWVITISVGRVDRSNI